MEGGLGRVPQVSKSLLLEPPAVVCVAVVCVLSGPLALPFAPVVMETCSAPVSSPQREMFRTE